MQDFVQVLAPHTADKASRDYQYYAEPQSRWRLEGCSDR